MLRASTKPDDPAQFPRVHNAEPNAAIPRTDVRELMNRRISDHRWTMGALGAAFLVLAGMIIGSYLEQDKKLEKVSDKIEKLADKIEALNRASVRVDTKPEDLLPAPPPSSPTILRSR